MFMSVVPQVSAIMTRNESHFGRFQNSRLFIWLLIIVLIVLYVLSEADPGGPDFPCLNLQIMHCFNVYR